MFEPSGPAANVKENKETLLLVLQGRIYIICRDESRQQWHSTDLYIITRSSCLVAAFIRYIYIYFVGAAAAIAAVCC
jgi:hypothetical protein